MTPSQGGKHVTPHPTPKMENMCATLLTHPPQVEDMWHPSTHQLLLLLLLLLMLLLLLLLLMLLMLLLLLLQAKGTGAKTCSHSPKGGGLGHCLATKHANWLDPSVLLPSGLSLMWGKCLVEIRLATGGGGGGGTWAPGAWGVLRISPHGPRICFGICPWSVMGKGCGRNPSGYLGGHQRL